MTHGLLGALRALRRQTLSRLMIAATAHWLSAVLVMIAVACIVDYLWRPADPVARWALSLSVWLGGWTAYRRWLHPVLRLRVDDVQFARWIERVDASWGDRLSSAVGFLLVSADEPRYGSARLRAALIDMVEQRVGRLQSSQYLSLRPAVRSLVVLAAVTACLAGLALWAPTPTGLAFRRVAVPWNSLAWPRRHVLALIDLPEKVVYGQDVDIVVVDRQGRLPAAVTLFYRPEGDSSARALPMSYSGGKMTYRLPNVTKPFSVRVTGGDDDAMAWQTVDVVPPPRIEWCQLLVKPPAYSGYQAYELTGAGPVLRGSSLAWRLSIQPGARQVLLYVDRPEMLGLPDGRTPLVADAVDEARQQFRISNEEIRLMASGRYWFEVHFDGGARWQSPAVELRMVADQPPAVRLEPLNRSGLITRNGSLRVTGQANDDFGVRRLVLRLQRGAGSGEVTQTIWQSDEPPRHEGLPPPAKADIHPFDYAMELGALELPDGTEELAVQVGVEDFAGQSQLSESVSLRLVTEQEYAAQLVQLYGQLLPQLEEAIKLQRATRDKGQQLDAHLAEGGTVAAEHVDLWKTAELQQRRVSGLLIDESSGLAPRVEKLLEELTANGLGVPDLARALKRLRTGLSEVRPWLARIETSMAEATRQLPEPPSFTVRPEMRPAPHVQAAIEAQTKVLAELEALRDAAAQWEGYRQFVGRLQEMATEQKQLGDRSAALQFQWLGRSVSELSAAQRGELRRLAQQQDELARRLEQLVRHMHAALPRLEVQNAHAAGAVRRALEAVDRHAVAASMRGAAQDVQNNRMGQAAENQRKAWQGLTAALEAIAGSGKEGQQQQLAELAEQLDTLLGRQEQLDARRADVAAAPQPEAVRQLVDEQQQLAGAAEETANAIADAQTGVSKLVGEAGESMRQSAQHAGEQKWQEADRFSQQAREALQRAAELVRSGQQLLSQERRAQLEEHLRTWLAQWLKAQTGIVDQTRELEEWRKRQSVWSSEQRRAVEAVATRQFQLATQLKQAVHELDGFPVLRFQLANLERLMAEAAARLGRFDAGERTQSLQARVVTLLAQLLDVFAQHDPERPLAGEPQTGVPAQDQAGQHNTPQGPTVSMQELRLLALIQEELRQRTQELERQRQVVAAEARDQWLSASQQLSDEQRRLAQLVADLFAGGETTPEKEP